MAASTDLHACPPSLRADAIELVLRDLPPELRVDLVQSIPPVNGKSLGPFDALLIAERDGQILAAAWAQPQPGRTAMLWPPQFVGTPDDDLAGDLIAAIAQAAGEYDLVLLQSILEPGDTVAARLLSNSGFTHIADLDYLEWLPQSIDIIAPPRVQFESYCPDQHERFKQVLGRTYLGSLDCPQLDALRSLDDVLAGYRATGDYVPKMWMLAVENGMDVGVLLLTSFRQSQQMEMIYMGVVPEARGRGIGTSLLQQAQSIALESRAKKLILGVDVANTPAQKLYKRAGLHPWLQRSVYVRAYPHRQ